MESVRLRIRFQFPVPYLEYSRKVWMLFNISDCRYISDLSYLIADKYGISRQPLLLHMDNYLLPPRESISVIKDNDVIDVSFKRVDEEDRKRRKTAESKKKQKNEINTATSSSSSSSDSTSSRNTAAERKENKRKLIKSDTSSSSSSSDSDSSSSSSSDSSDDEAPLKETAGIKSNKSSSQSSSLQSVTKHIPEIKPLTSRPSTGRPSTSKLLNIKSSTSKPSAIKATTGKSSNTKPSTSTVSTKKPLASTSKSLASTSKPLTLKQTSKPSTTNNVPVASKPPIRPSTTQPAARMSAQSSGRAPGSSNSSHVYFSSDEDNDSSVMEVEEEKVKVIKEEKDYSKYPPLISFPPVGSVIAFKTLELSPEDYTPLLSDYKEGTVLSVTDHSLVVLLDDDTIAREKIKAIKETEGKFSLPDAEPFEPESEININYNDLIEAKLCK